MVMEMQVTASVDHSSTIMIKTILYEYVLEPFLVFPTKAKGSQTKPMRPAWAWFERLGLGN